VVASSTLCSAKRRAVVVRERKEVKEDAWEFESMFGSWELEIYAETTRCGCEAGFQGEFEEALKRVTKAYIRVQVVTPQLWPSFVLSHCYMTIETLVDACTTHRALL